MCRSAPPRFSDIERLLEIEENVVLQFDVDALSELDTLDYYSTSTPSDDEMDDLYALAQEEGRQWAVYAGAEPPRDEDDWHSIRDAANRGLTEVLGVEFGDYAEWEPAQP